MRLFLVFALLAVLSARSHAANFQQYVKGNCPGLICKISFNAVPAGKRLEVSNASCYFRVHADAGSNLDLTATRLLVVQANGTAAHTVILRPTFVDSYGPSPIRTIYESNDQIFAFAEEGQRVQAQIQLAHGVFEEAGCHISGKLVP